MAPAASVLIPTRRRRDHLAVALAAAAPQAAAHGGELVVVEDDAADPVTRALCEACGARYLALGAHRGLNVARTAAIEAAAGELLCFLDDDAEPWPDWLGALLAGAARHPEWDVLGGPIRPRLEGARWPWCGGEAPPVTALDLGPDDTEARFAWGANMAVRRAALTLAGPFDPALSGLGDEEEWQRRLHAAGGRVGYLAAAGVDHRRAGADAGLRRLAHAAHARGRAARRWDATRGAAPPPAAELRLVARCLGHAGRRRCANGLLLAADAAGRLREAVAPAPVPPTALGAPAPLPATAMHGAPAPLPPTAAHGVPLAGAGADPPYLSGVSGTLSRRGELRGALLDLAADAASLRRRATVARAARGTPPRRQVLALCVARPAQPALARAAAAELARSRHDVEVRLITPAPGAGKWQNLNAALAAHPAAGRDWLLVLDDDVVLPRGFLDAFLALSEAFGFELAQPAHAHRSHAAWAVTRRRRGVVARRTRFVEIGPVTALHAPTFAELLPFPDLRMGWGLDAHWGAVAAARGWPVGIVDAVPVRHTRPVAGAYGRDAALAEAAAFLAERPFLTRAEALETLETHRRVPR